MQITPARDLVSIHASLHSLVILQRTRQIQAQEASKWHCVACDFELQVIIFFGPREINIVS
jgi:hypothetical protein